MADNETKVIITGQDLTKKAFDSATKNAQAFGTALTSLFAPLAAVTSGAAFAGLIKSQIDLGESLQKLHEKTGISVEDLSAYQYAAGLSEVSTDELNIVLKKLGNNINDAIVNKGGEAAMYFRALGVDIVDNTGKARNLGSVFEDLSGKLKNVTNDVQRTSAENILLGKSGSTIDPLINNLQKLKGEAYSTGKVMSGDFAKDAEKFNDNIKRLSANIDIMARGIATNLLPVLNRSAEDFLILFGNTTTKVKRVQEELAASQEMLAKKIALNAIPQAIKLSQDRIIELSGELRKLKAENPELFKPVEEKPKAGTGLNIDISGDKDREAFFKLQADLENRVAAIDQSLMTEKQLYEKHVTEVNAILGNALATGVIFQGDADRIREQMELQHQAKLGDLSAEGALERQQFEQMTTRQQAKSVLGELLQLTAGVAAHNKTMFQINKVAGIANAIIHTYEGVTLALAKYPPPLSFIMAAAQLAAGIAQVQQIKATQFGSSTSAPSIGGGGALPVTQVGGPQNIPSLDQSQTGQQRTVQIQFIGMIGTDQFVRESVIPAIRDATDNADMIIFNSNSRQAQEMRQ